MSETTHPRKLRAKDVAKLYSVAISTVWNYARDGRLKAIKVSPFVTVFDYEQCEAFFNGQSNES